MAERLNAHDSKSCYAGMYTRVQIPFSAPKKDGYFCPSFLYKRLLKGIWGLEPFCESKTLCRKKKYNTTNLSAKDDVDNVGAGRAAKSAIPVDRTTIGR